MSHGFRIAEELRRLSSELRALRQNRLLDESRLISFAKTCAIPVFGVINGDPGRFHDRDWLRQDDANEAGRPLFHPFRVYVLHKVLARGRLGIAPSALLASDSVEWINDHAKRRIAPAAEVDELAAGANEIVDLAVLLEPLYWPRISGKVTYNNMIDETAFEEKQRAYRNEMAALLRGLEPATWRHAHETLRTDAAWIDDNGALYLLLRLGTWTQRERTKGSLSCALWIRHVAEVIRRGFEELLGEQWPEEDEAFGVWSEGGREITYGFARPLDHESQAKPHIAWNFGLYTGSIVRWYVEGDTEYYAIRELVPEPSRIGIEMVNLRGMVGAGRGNVGLRLQDFLEEDLRLRRFSILSFDADVDENIRVVRRQIERNAVVGTVELNRPDFEFANFTLGELVEVAARCEDANGFEGRAIRQADWTGIKSGRAFEGRYSTLSKRGSNSLKGEQWGRALAKFAAEHPSIGDTKVQRPLWKGIGAALRARYAHYDLQRSRYKFDPNTFELMDRTSHLG